MAVVGRGGSIKPATDVDVADVCPPQLLDGRQGETNLDDRPVCVRRRHRALQGAVVQHDERAILEAPHADLEPEPEAQRHFDRRHRVLRRDMRRTAATDHAHYEQFTGKCFI